MLNPPGGFKTGGYHCRAAGTRTRLRGRLWTTPSPSGGTRTSFWHLKAPTRYGTTLLIIRFYPFEITN
jgi:hypothetical protein